MQVNYITTSRSVTGCTPSGVSLQPIDINDNDVRRITRNAFGKHVYSIRVHLDILVIFMDGRKSGESLTLLLYRQLFNVLVFVKRDY
jgi:hypothetical protein